MCEHREVSIEAPALALALAAALHAGFQLVVTFVVYPAFASVRDEDWTTYHANHTRRVLPVVAVVYGLLAASCLWVLVTGPERAGSWVALGASATAALVTAAVAAPAHGRMSEVRRARDARLLIIGDQLRLLAAVVAVVAATWALLA